MRYGTDTHPSTVLLNGPAPAVRADMAPSQKPDRLSDARFRVDGRYFARAGTRFSVHGVTYGPFEPGSDGHPLPAVDRVRADFVAMQDAGLNAVRMYLVPPGWLFEL